MGVYIKGMEMPTSCDECPLYTCMHNHDDCPLVPVSPHGRLIDADVLAAKCDSPHWCVWLSDIDAAPTVVPAEEAAE